MFLNIFIIITVIILLFLFAYALIRGISFNKTLEEILMDEQEQMDYIKKWNEEHGEENKSDEFI